MAAWKLPLIVAGITVPIVAAFGVGFTIGVGGSGLGLAVAALVSATIVVIAVRQRPRGRIDSAPATDARRHVLLVATCPVEAPGAVAQLARAGGLGAAGGDADVLVLAPTRFGFLDRWASDVEPARRAAQENLVATVAGLAKAGIEAEARVGDEDIVQAVEDQLQTFPATEVVLASSEGELDAEGGAVEELGSRLAAEFRHVVIDRPQST